MTAASARKLRAYPIFFLAFFAVLLVSHWPVLSLPYFWDEMGQFVPAGLDILRLGKWVPVSTLPNVHPPGVMAYLAGFWTITGYSVTATRTAMLLLAAAGVLGTFLLAIRVSRDLPGAPALIAPLLLMCSPLFWAQSMMAQLDMPAMVFTVFALLLFLQNRMVLCTLACTAAVLCKESSLAIPFVFGCVLLWERRWRESVLFFIPALAVAGWLYVLWSATGHVLGNPEFAHYNVSFQMNAVRLPLTLIRRIYYLFIDNFHFIGTILIVLAWRKSSLFRNRDWTVIGLAAGMQVLVVTVLGGAALERYLMPVMPLFYIAVGVALTQLSRTRAAAAAAIMVAGLSVSILVNSPFTYPYENNAAFVSFVRLQQQAAHYIEAELPGRTVVSAWPFPDALRRPEFGYVTKPQPVRGIENFNPETVLALAGNVDVLVVYSRTWEPQWGVLRSQWVRQFLARHYFYQPQITSAQIQRRLGLHPVARWEENGQWIEIYTRSRTPNLLIL